MTDPIRINVQHYGAIEVQCPPGVEEDVAAGLVIDAISQLMQLIDPAKAVERFHPALGFETRGGGGSETSAWQATPTL